MADNANYDGGSFAEAGKLFDQGKKASKEYEFEKAVELWTKAADMGHAGAMCALANYYSGWGVEPNEEKAFKLYTKAADLGDVNAWYMIGVYYETGTGVPKNLAKAKECYQKAAAKGHEKAKDNLAKLNLKPATSTGTISASIDFETISDDVTCDDDPAYVLWRSGDTNLKNGNYDKAISDYTEALDECYEGYDGEINLNLGIAYFKKGNFEQAIINFKKSAEYPATTAEVKARALKNIAEAQAKLKTDNGIYAGN